jgi:hypothetical protein
VVLWVVTPCDPVNNDKRYPAIPPLPHVAFMAIARHLYFLLYPGSEESWGSSVSIVSEYRLDDRGSIRGSDKGVFL